MPHWIELLAVVLAIWLTAAVVGGLLIGRALAVIERRHARRDPRRIA